jgi:lipoprotein NlpD
MKWFSYLSGLSMPLSLQKQTDIATGKYSVSTSKLIISSAVVILMAGCASKPVVNPAQSRLVVIPQYYTVKSGDTLSQIAARFNLDYREIARINNIDSRYTIYTNQSLRLHNGGKDAPRIQVRTSATPTHTPIQASTLPAQTVRPTAQTTAPVRTTTSV